MSFTRLVLVARWSFSQLLLSPRTIGMGALAFTPVFVAVVYRVAAALELAPGISGFRVFSVLTASISLPFVVPMLSLFYASGVVSDDAEAGTLRYFLIRPIPRPELIFGKMIASATMALFLFVPPFVLSYYLTLAPSGFAELGTRFPTLLRDLLAVALALFAYNGLFALAGTVLRRPLLFGLFFVFGWQAGAAVVPGSARLFTVTHYLNSLIPRGGAGGALAQLTGERATMPEAIVALLVIGAATHLLAAWCFRRKEL